MHKPFSTGLVWFRRDLRVADNAALFHALKPWKAHVQALVKAFLHESSLSGEEEVFLLMTVRKLLE
jgi:deoxyribodipyrimidine photolyase